MELATKLYTSKLFWIKILTFFTILQFTLSCVPYMHQPLEPRRARLGPETPQNKELTSLPKPSEKIVAAVYKFRDQTGQYKPSDMGSSWSTAISQGTTAILLRALEESGWFIPIERENISNLLNERKIIRSSRAQYETDKQATVMPPLIFAGIILEGGIISYESNIVTGGLGLRYFGTGINGQYREDMVSVYLRVVSTNNGKILKTVYTTKSILSQQIDAGVFKYVKFKRLLEAETGFTYNEPSEMAVTEAIEKAVTVLVLEGYEDGLWTFANKGDSTLPIVSNYRKERANNENLDYFGRLLNQTYRGKFSLSFNGGVTKFDGDYPEPDINPFGEIKAGYMLNRSLLAEIGISKFSLNSRPKNKTEVINLTGGFNYKFSTATVLTPFIEAGVGIIRETDSKNLVPVNTLYTGFYGAGFEWLPTPKIGLTVGADHIIISSDKFDGLEHGNYYDMIWTAQVGVNFYIGTHKVKKKPVVAPL